LIQLVWASIRHRALRSLTAITAMAIAMGVMTVTVAGLRRADLLSADTPDTKSLTSANVWLPVHLSYAARLGQLPGVVGVEYWDLHVALDATPDRARLGNLVRASDGYFPLSAPGMTRLSQEAEARWRSDKQGMVSSASVAARMGWKEGQLVSLAWRNVYSGQDYQSPFHFLGTYQGALPDALVVHYDYLDQLLAPEDRGQVFMMDVVRAKGSEDSADQAITGFMKETPDPLIAGSSREWTASELAGELSTTSTLEGVSAVLLAITWAIVGTAVSMSLRERRVEIGTLRGLGFARGRVFTLILLESATVALAAFVMGVLLPATILALSGQGFDLGPDLLTHIRPGPVEVLFAGAVAVLLSLTISFWPAVSASRQDIVNTLRED
jgi:hypothetical protein